MNDNEKTTTIHMLLDDGTVLDPQETSRRYVDALSCLLLGKSADHSAAGFGGELLVMVGPELDHDGLLWLGGIAADNLRSVVYATVLPETPNFPNIALAAHIGDKIHIHQHCMLSLSKNASRGRLVPRSFTEGGYRFNASGQPQLSTTAANFQAGVPDMTRAYDRLGKLIRRRPHGDWAPDLLSAA